MLDVLTETISNYEFIKVFILIFIGIFIYHILKTIWLLVELLYKLINMNNEEIDEYEYEDEEINFINDEKELHYRNRKLINEIETQRLSHETYKYNMEQKIYDYEKRERNMIFIIILLSLMVCITIIF